MHALLSEVFVYYQNANITVYIVGLRPRRMVGPRLVELLTGFLSSFVCKKRYLAEHQAQYENVVQVTWRCSPGIFAHDISRDHGARVE